MKAGRLYTSTAMVLSLLFLGSAAANAETAAALAEKMKSGFDDNEVLFPLQQALREKPQDAQLHFELGKLCMNSGSKLRGARELQLCLKLAPTGPLSAECKQLLANWSKQQAEFGKQRAWSNFDYWFDDYYKVHEYHSTDPNPEPAWATKTENQREWKVDVHLMEWKDPERQPVSCFGPVASELMKVVHDRFEALAKKQHVGGSADIYFQIDANGVLHPTLARLEGGEPFRSLLQQTCAGLIGSKLLKAGANQAFKARLASRFDLQNSGTWYAFTARNLEETRKINLDLGPEDADTTTTKGTHANTVMIPPECSSDASSSGSSAVLANKNTQISPKLSAAAPSTSKFPRWQFIDAKPPGYSWKPEPPGNPTRALLEKSKVLLQNAEFKSCFNELWPLVERDNSEACLLMGKALSSNKNPKPQPRVAEVFYEKAARAGNLEAVELLADAVEFGNSQFPWPQTVQLLKFGADKGSAKCQFTLGRHLEFGDGLDQNKALAMKYYRRAAASGDPNAKAALERLTKTASR